MDKGLVFNKRVGPNKHVGRNFSKTLINIKLGSPSKITIENKKLKSKVKKSQYWPLIHI